MARSGVITLGEIAEPLPMLDVECSRCGRQGRYGTAKLVERFGADEAVQPFQDWITKDCSRRHDSTLALGMVARLIPELKLLTRNRPR